jgi:amino acid transporter
MAFLFIWQFLISGPLELGSGLVAINQFAPSLSQDLKEFNEQHTWRWKWGDWEDPTGESQPVGIAIGPSRLFAFALGLLIMLLLYRNISSLGKLTVTFWVGVLFAIVWILLEGAIRFDRNIAFDYSGDAAAFPDGFAGRLGLAMILAIYSYLGYYNVCYIGDEVREPGRVIPRSIVLSTLAVIVLFIGLHLAMLGTVPWYKVLEQSAESDDYSLPAKFMETIHGPWAAAAITVLLIWCCFGSAFAGLLGYSRIPYGAARNGHFFSIFARVHPGERIPHFSLLLVGALMLFWAFFDLQTVINALITTRILEQFVGQIVAVVLLRTYQPDRYRPYKMVLYPLPCLLALIGWLFLYWSAGWFFIALGIGTLTIGVGVFLVWSRYTRTWPFELSPESPSAAADGLSV